MTGQADGSIIIDTDLDASKLEKGMDNLRRSMEGLTATIERIGKRMESTLSAYTKALAGGVRDVQRLQDGVEQTGDSTKNALSEMSTKTKEISTAADKTAESYGTVAREAEKAKAATGKLYQETSESAKKAASDVEESAQEAEKTVRAEMNGIQSSLLQLNKNFETVQNGGMAANGFLLNGFIEQAEQAANQLQSLRSRLTSSGEDEELQYSEAEISKLTQRLYELEEQARTSQEEIRNFARESRIALGENTDNAPAIANLEPQIEAAEAALARFQVKVDKMDAIGASDKAWASVAYDIQKAAEKVAEYMEQVEHLKASGEIGDEDYERLIELLNALQEKATDVANVAGADLSDLFGNAAQSADSAEQSLRDVDRELQQKGPDAEEAGRGVSALGGIFDGLSEKVKNTAKALASIAGGAILAGLRAIGTAAGEAAQNLTKLTATAVSSGIKRLGAWLSNAAKSMTLFGRSAKRNNGVLKKSFSTILKYGLGVRSFYYLFRKIRQAIAEGYQNLARYSDTLNTSISGVISSFKRFENQFAASFAPLVNAIAPAISQLIDGLTEATFRAGQFIAVLSGQKTVIRAKEVQEDYAASLEETKKAAKAAEKQLAGFDQLNILKKPDDKGTDPEDMFETVPVEDKAKNSADAFKEAWVNVDLSGIGKIVGDKLKVALDKIPWPDIKKAASDLGKRLATFLNGLINVPGLGKSLGKSIAEAINTAFAFLDGFVWNFDWKGLGNAIMDTVEAACDNLDWKPINHALRGLAIGLADLLNTIFSRKEVWEKIGKTIGEAINAAVLFGLTFLERFNFNQAASAIVVGLNGAVSTIRLDNIGQLLGDLLGGALQFLYTAVTEFDWELLGNKIAVGVNAFTSTVRRKIYDINWADMGAAVADGINTAIIGIEWGGVGETVGMLLGGALTAVAAFIRELNYSEIVQAIQDFFSSALQQIDFYDLLTVWGVAALIVAVKKIIAKHPILALLTGAVLALGPELGNVIHKMVSDIPWEEVGATVGNAFLGALSRINDAIASVNWVEIGEAVGRFLGSINWLEIIGEVAELIMNVIAHGLELIAGVLIGLGPEKILKAIGVAVAAILAGVALMGIAGMILTAITPIIIGALTAIAGLLASPAIIVAAIATAIAGIITYLVTRKKDMEDAGEDVGNGFLYGVGKMFVGIFGWIKEHIFQPFIDAWRNLWQEHSPSKVMENEGGLIIAGLFNGISAAWHSITEFFGNALDGLKTTLGGAWNAISGAASDAWNGISGTLSSVWETISTNADGALKGIVKDVSGKWNNIKTDASTAWGDIQKELPRKAEEIKTGVLAKVRELAAQALPFWRQSHTDAEREWKQTETSVTQSARTASNQALAAFRSLQGSLSGVWSGIRSAASGALSSVSSTVSSMVTSISSRVSSIRATVSNITSSASDALSRVADKMDDLTRKASNGVGVSLGGFASGGVIRDGGRMSWWDNVRKYASGTLKAAGSLFVAGESGPEIVGHVNGRTEVLNESQIAGAIYSAVLSAMSEAVKTLGGFLSQQMAANTNALITAIGQIQPPQPVAVPQDMAMTERLAALQAVPYQVPAYATGTVMPYEVVAEIRRQTSELTAAIYGNGEQVIQAVVSAISNHGLALANAIGNIQTAPQQGYSPEFMAQYTVDYINRQTRMMGRSPLSS